MSKTQYQRLFETIKLLQSLRHTLEGENKLLRKKFKKLKKKLKKLKRRQK